MPQAGHTETQLAEGRAIPGGDPIGIGTGAFVAAGVPAALHVRIQRRTG